MTAHNSAAKGPFELRTRAKEAQDHDLSDGSGPGAVGCHLNVVTMVLKSKHNMKSTKKSKQRDENGSPEFKMGSYLGPGDIFSRGIDLKGSRGHRRLKKGSYQGSKVP